MNRDSNPGLIPDGAPIEEALVCPRCGAAADSPDDPWFDLSVELDPTLDARITRITCLECDRTFTAGEGVAAEPAPDRRGAPAASADITAFVQRCLEDDPNHPHELSIGRPRSGDPAPPPADGIATTDDTTEFVVPQDLRDELPTRPFPATDSEEGT